MSFPKLVLLVILTATAHKAISQEKHTVSGTITDKNTGEVLIGATAVLLENPSIGAISNSYGFYSLTAPAGNYTLVVSYSGYQPDTLKIRLTKNIEWQPQLRPSSKELQNVVVAGRSKFANVTSPLMGVQNLSIKEMNDVPVLFGEKDIFKTIQLLPGIKSAGDGNSGIFVRGGAADQNLVLLDEAVVYNPDHLLGFFSTFNSDAIKDVTVYKGGMPAEYGGRLSSVIDIRMNDGNDQKLAGSGGVGLISSRLNLEGPLKKNKGSFIISGRRTYADLFLKLSRDTNVNRNSLYFYDLNAKANYKLNENNHVYLSGYFGRDVLSFSNTFGIQWGNTTGTARWNHIFNSRLFSNTSLIYSNYNYIININSSNNNIDLVSKIIDLSLKEDYQYYISPSSTLKFGFDVIHHTFSPGIINATSTSRFNSLDLPKKYDFENAVYISHEWSPVKKLHLEYGLRFSAFSILGPGSFYTYDSLGNVTSTATYPSGKIVKTYFNPEPRISASWILNKTSSLKASYTRNTQYLHLLSNSTAANPTDLWIPSSNNVKPGLADQESIGYYRNFANNTIEFSSELYYKSMQNQIDYKNGAQLVANINVESQLLFGKGRAYGWELFIKKKTGKFTGWVSYTLSRTELKIDGINNDKWYPAKQDITHDVSIVGIYKPNSKWTLSATWVFNTGNAVTFPNGKYEVNGQTVFYYTQRNGYRMPPYHRLDLAATLENRKRKHWQSSWTFSVYNAYDRANAYAIIFQNDPNNPSLTQAVQYSLFKIVPSVTYNFKF
jgi:CarboxypepD_reg-like domain/TonB-dependent Receptor Plug Domain